MTLPTVRVLIAICLLLAFVGCSTRVNPDKIVGTYVARHPFGTETLVLSKDGRFTQEVVIPGEKPALFQGTWSYDARDGYVTFHNLARVDDGLGKLNRNWRTDVGGISALSAEILWLKQIINSGAEHPYIKQAGNRAS
jgi:hypothetical protein